MNASSTSSSAPSIASPAAPSAAAPSTDDRRAVLEGVFREAISLHGGGALAAAEERYRRLLQWGAVTPIVLTNYALLLRQTGRGAQSVAALRRALEMDPCFDGAHYGLGNALGGLGDAEGALNAFRRVVALIPDHVFAHNNIGNAHRARKRHREALAAYDRAIRSGPDQPDPRIHAGIVSQNLGLPVAALARYRGAVTLDPAKVEGLLNLGNGLLDAGDGAGAARWFRRAVIVRPDYPDARGNLATALRDRGRTAEAMALYRMALALDPASVNVLTNVGNALNYAGEGAAAPIHYRRALAIDPGDPLAHFDLGVTLLQLGRYREGWAEYEWRWGGGGDGGPLRMRDFERPMWDGGDLDGTLLVHAEQGMGDVLQFLRYLPLMARRVGAIVLEIHAPLMALARDLPGVVQVVPRGGPLPPFDAHIPFLSLGRVFDTGLDDIPGDFPYLRPEPGRVAEWGRRMGELDRGAALRVGFVWAGSATFKGDLLRSPRLGAMAPLLDVGGTAFFSLQKGDGRRDLEGRTMPANFHDLDPWIGDFSDTAAAMANLDLVISSCTAPVHLAGAMGVPTWVALPFAADWRWLEGREDSPWYPSVRLFRQSVPGDWDDVIRRLSRALDDRVRGAPNTRPAAAVGQR